jgi:hypothetical protein
MYYWRVILNNNNLFQRFGSWLEKSQNDFFINPRIEELLARATCAFINLNRIKNINDFCIQQYDELENYLNIKDNEIGFWSPSLAEMFNEFSSYLSNLRIMQNLIWCITVRQCNSTANPPKSINDGIKKIDKYGLDSELKVIIQEYMHCNGNYIKSCRDIDQHYFPIIEHSFLQINPKKQVKVILPDNPDVQSKMKLKFDEKIDAQEFFQHSFSEFHDFSDKIAKYFGFEPRDIPHTIKNLYHRGFDERTLFLYIDNPYRCAGIEFYQNSYLKILPRELPIPRKVIKPESMVFNRIKLK